jgi:two-component system, OmpR family, KDP operon response regulator KdpE
MKILVIEDDKSIIESVKLAIRFRWPEAELISSCIGKGGIRLNSEENPDVIILDINLPDISGFVVLDKIRETSKVPIIIMTVRSDDSDIMHGLENGADDYVTKPFNILTLLSRINAVIRRTGRENPDEVQPNNPRLKIDYVNQKVKIDNHLVKLSPIEFRLLVLLIKNNGRPVTYTQIMQNVWEKKFDGQTEIVRICVQRLRKKLGDIPATQIINEHGNGYMFKG